MTLKVCNNCGGTKPLRDFHKNGSGRYRPSCKICLRKRGHALSEEKKLAVKMWQDGKSLTEIGRAFGRDRRSVSYWLHAAGINTTKRSRASVNWGRKGDADALKPIGALPAASKWTQLDAAILKARLEAGMIDGRRRIAASPWPAQSSLVSEVATK